MTPDEELEELLNNERRVILGGGLLDIEPLASRKLTLFQALHSGSTLSVHRLKRLAKLASRNATLLEASAHGIKAAIRQVEEASALNSQQFYGPDGERQCMAADAPALKKKM